MFLHRLPHMKMDKKIMGKINLILFFIVIVLACTFEYSKIIFEIFSTFEAALDQLIIPGLFFFYKFKDKWLKEDVDVPQFILDVRIYSNKDKTSKSGDTSSLGDTRKSIKRMN